MVEEVLALIERLQLPPTPEEGETDELARRTWELRWRAGPEYNDYKAAVKNVQIGFESGHRS
jgi:hypothetical protein